MIFSKHFKNKSPVLSVKMAAKIKYLWINTPLNQAQIAAELGGLNQGRISEVLNGSRYSEIPASMEF